MTSRPDEEWARLGAVWRTDEHAVPVAEALQVRVRRYSRRLRLAIIAEACLTIVALGVVWWILAAVPVRTGWAIAAVVHSAIVWVFVLWNRWGIWRPASETTRAYLALERERARRQVHTGRFVIGLMAVEAVVFAIVAVTTDSWRRSPAAWITALAIFGGFAVWGAWWLARARRARGEIEALAARLTAEDSEPAS